MVDQQDVAKFGNGPVVERAEGLSDIRLLALDLLDVLAYGLVLEHCVPAQSQSLVDVLRREVCLVDVHGRLEFLCLLDVLGNEVLKDSLHQQQLVGRQVLHGLDLVLLGV